MRRLFRFRIIQRIRKALAAVLTVATPLTGIEGSELGNLQLTATELGTLQATASYLAVAQVVGVEPVGSLLAIGSQQGNLLLKGIEL